ncbi:MAG TPA: TolC family protein [Candidatus Hydrogenedentes bacterium]|nr:TolC family protein [Candidatus Hydrogenedentota bacterium]HOV72666.1 TolC family protein [Candidatus Hydrogenedentota bacterium]HPC16462.1 TolC family protein [Candidatus Hydrogenedentota bacterium]HRT20173.1 TolC family protein [Candidatus Hydrogenedentota bacterium]HRT63207.1 TolC family protein [Candidatus Hydrogenedentota bacterium]
MKALKILRTCFATNLSCVLMAMAFDAPALTLTDALAMALEKNPGLASFSWEIRAAEAREIQARLHPNPEISFEVEDIAVGGGVDRKSQSPIGIVPMLHLLPYSPPSSETQFTLSLAQRVEFGGKRVKRMALAACDRDVARWDYEMAKADVIRDVTKAFVDVLSTQERAALDCELVQLAEKTLQSVSARVEAGRVSPLDETKAETALLNARVQADRSKRALAVARIRLAALWGETEATFERADGDIECVRPIPPWEILESRIRETPDLLRWQAEIAKREAAIKVEKTKAISDVTLSLGYRKLDGNSENLLVAGVSVPIPLFHRNQGAIMEAEHLAAKARDDRRGAEIAVRGFLKAAHEELSATQTAIASLKETILPASTLTFAQVNEAYRQGKFGYLDVLDAQRTLFEARREYLDALTDYHRGIAEMERLFGASLWAEGESLK